MNDPLFIVKDWNDVYENNRSRTVQEARWVAMPRNAA